MKVIIYTMGRVGTNMISNSIVKKHTEVINIHTMNEKLSLDNIVRPNNKLIEPKITRINELLRSGEDILIISPVRNPVVRALSAFCFFHNVWGIGPRTTPREAKGIFAKKYPWKWALDFFDNEIKTNIGIDPYELSFNEKIVLQKKNLKLLIIKTGILTRDLAKVLNRMGIKTKHPRSKNKAKGKMSSLYRGMKKLKYPKEIINGICNSKFTQHFFSKDVEEIRRRWIEQ